MNNKTISEVMTMFEDAGITPCMLETFMDKLELVLIAADRDLKLSPRKEMPEQQREDCLAFISRLTDVVFRMKHISNAPKGPMMEK